MRKKLIFIICLIICSLTILLTGCTSSPFSDTVPKHPTPALSPTADVSVTPVISVSPEPLVIDYDSFTPSKVNELSGKYEFTFPGFFDKCNMSSDDASILYLYSSTLYDDIYFVIIYERTEQAVSELVMQKLGITQLPPVCKEETLSITLPKEFFKEASEGYCEADIKLIMYYPASIDSSLLQFEITENSRFAR